MHVPPCEHDGWCGSGYVENLISNDYEQKCGLPGRGGGVKTGAGAPPAYGLLGRGGRGRLGAHGQRGIRVGYHWYPRNVSHWDTNASS